MLQSSARTAVLGALLLTLWPSGDAHAGAWTQAEGQCYAKVWARAIVGSGAFETEGDTRSDITDYADVSAQLYAECGLHPQLTAIVFGAPFGYASAGSESAVYVGPIGVGLRFEPYWSTGATRFALQAAYSFAPPVGDDVLFEEAGADPRVFYQAALENHYGEIQALLGHGFSISRKVSAWFSGGAGVRINSAGSMSPALVASLQLGFTFYERFQLEVHVPIYEPFGRGITETNISGVGQTRYLSGETTPENAERARDAIYALMLARAEEVDESERSMAYTALFIRFDRELPAESRRRYADFQLELLRSADRSTATLSADVFHEAANAHFTTERDIIIEGEAIIAARAATLVAEGLLNAPMLEARAASATSDSDALGLWRTDTGVRARLRNSDHRTYTEALYRLQITSPGGSQRSVDWLLLDEARLNGGDVVEASLDIPGLEASDRIVMEPVSGERR